MASSGSPPSTGEYGTYRRTMQKSDASLMPHSAASNDILNVPQLSDTMDTGTIYLQKSRWIKLIDVSTADSGHGTQLTDPHRLMAGQAAGKRKWRVVSGPGKLAARCPVSPRRRCGAKPSIGIISSNLFGLITRPALPLSDVSMMKL